MDAKQASETADSNQAVKLAHFKPPKGRPYTVVIKGERVLISSVPKDGRPAILVELEGVEEGEPKIKESV